MVDLKLIPANQNRDQGPWSDDDFDVVIADTGETVGRIFRDMVSPGNPNGWFWGFAFPHSLNARDPCYGHAASKEAAKAAFAERWRS
jgi:hypothetical protein